MKLSTFRSKRVIIPTLAAAVALGAGSVVWASAANAGSDVQGAERERVGAAAVQAVGGGTATEVETSDEAGGAAFEAEVRKPDGTEVEVTLDKDLKVLGQQAEDGDKTGAEAAVPAAERASAEKAALAEVPGGTVTDVEAGDNAGVAYEVEVRDAGNAEWDIDLDATFKVLAKKADD